MTRQSPTGHRLGAGSGAALTIPYPARASTHWIDFLERVEAWLPAAERVYAIVDNLGMHRALDVLLFALAHPAGRSSSSRPVPPTST